MNAGITSQYGFLYQRLIFVYKVLKNISPSCLFVFEGKDDIDVLPAEQISSITQDQSTYVQVKSGTVDQNCFNKIICNWLLMNDKPDPTYVLILENELSFEYDMHISAQLTANTRMSVRRHTKTTYVLSHLPRLTIILRMFIIRCLKKNHLFALLIF